MQAWIATDVDGESFLYFSEPQWSEEDGWWEGASAVMCPHDLVKLCPADGYCQPIELTATPTGEAKGGKG